MGIYMEVTTKNCIDFLTNVLGIDEAEINSFIKHALVLFNHGDLEGYDLDTEEKVIDEVFNVLVAENSDFTSFQNAYFTKMIEKA